MTAPSPRGALLRTEEVVWLRVDQETDPGTVRRRSMELAERIGLSEEQVAEVAIVTTELSTNLVRHAVEGVVVLRVLRCGGVGGLEVVSIDHGPGVRDLRALSEDGSSAGGTLGIGLGAVRRLSTRNDAHSTPGRGTVVTASFWVDAPDGWSCVAGLTRALEGEDECGDAYAVRPTERGWLLLSVDGLGHGPLAAYAAAAATRLFEESEEESPAELMRLLHVGLTGTRGAAVAIGSLDVTAGRLVYTGVGNIAGRIVEEGHIHRLLTFPGIIGDNARTIKETTYDVTPGAWVVMHSDGVSERWSADLTPGVLERSALVVAATVMREAAVVHDDASVLVARSVAADVRRPPGGLDLTRPSAGG